MSDEPEGPGWWIASDGKWYPPELHPSVRTDDPQPEAVPDNTVTTGSRPAPHRWQSQGAAPAQDDEVPRVGPQFPDLFQKALQGSHLADNVSVQYSGDDPRNSFDPAPRSPSTSVPTGGSASGSGAVGSFSGATTKRRWRRGH